MPDDTVRVSVSDYKTRWCSTCDGKQGKGDQIGLDCKTIVYIELYV